MQELLSQLNRVRGVGGSLLVSSDGLTMASALRAGTDESTLAAAVGELVGNAQRIAQLLGLGDAGTFTAHSEQGGILVLACGPAFVAILVDPAANIALLLIEARPLIERLAGRITL